MTVYIFMISFILLYNNINAQATKKYKVEYCKFLKFIRNDIFENLGYKNISLQKDTINILEYTANKDLFISIPFYGNISTNDILNEEEKIEVIKKIYQDSTENKIEISCIDKCYLIPEIIAKKMNSIIYKFSNPVFAKNYSICYFSVGIYNDEYKTQNSYLFIKKHGAWKLVKRIGGIYGN